MKIALIGNMNNNFFNLTRYLRDSGFQAHLFLLNHEHGHFHPSHDSFDLEYQTYTRELAWGDRNTFLTVSGKAVFEDLREYDFLIGCNTAPAYAHLAGRRLDIFSPYGSDLYELPFGWPSRGSLWARAKSWRYYRRFHSAQKNGITNSAMVNHEILLGASRRAVEKLGVMEKVVHISQPMVYHKLYGPEVIQRNYQRSAWYREFDRVRSRFDLLIFHHSRHLWKTYVDELSAKGNDVLFFGLKRFLKANPTVKAGLVTFEYGPDVHHSKRLVRDLGMEEHVVWFPMMSRKEILIGLSLADVATGQFSIGAILNGVLLECIALGKPVIHYKDPRFPVQAGISDYPYLQAGEDTHICSQLETCMKNPASRRRLGHQAALWYREHFAGRCVRDFSSLIKAREGGHFESVLQDIRTARLPA